jgi:hypothetical protein
MMKIHLVAAAAVVAGVAGCDVSNVPALKLPAVSPVITPTNHAEQVLRGTKQASTAIDVNGTEAVALDETTSWSVPVTLNEGINTVSVSARDSTGKASGPVDITIVLDTSIPEAPTLDDPLPRRTEDASVLLRGQLDPDTRLVVDGVLQDSTSSTFSVRQPLLIVGDNEIRLAAENGAGTESAVLSEVVTLVSDDAPPSLVVTEPLDGALAAESVTVSGTATDDSAVDISYCLGTCPGAPIRIASHDPGITDAGDPAAQWSVDIPLHNVADDDDLAVTISAVDEWGHAATPVVLHLVHVLHPVSLPGVTPSQLTLAGGAVPFQVSLAWLDSAGAVASASIDTSTAIPTGDQQQLAVNAEAVAMVRSGSSAYVAWTLGGSGIRFHDTGDALATDEVALATVAHSLDVGALANGAGVIAYSDDTSVQLVVQNGADDWKLPVLLSDATTLAPTDVRLAIASDDTITVAWVETSDRDGTLDDTDVVAVRADGTGALGPVLLVSAGDPGELTDGASTSPRLVALEDGASGDHRVALAWLEDQTAELSIVDDAALNGAGAPPQPSSIGVSVSAVAIAADADNLAVVVQNSAGLSLRVGPSASLIAGSTAPAESVTVTPSLTAHTPAVSLSGSLAHVAYVDGVDVFVLPLAVSAVAP